MHSTIVVLLLVHLQEHQSEKVIVYFLTCACVDYMSGEEGWAFGVVRVR